MTQDATRQIKSYWRFPNSADLNINLKKKHFSNSFAFDAPIVWNDVLDDVHSSPTLVCLKKMLKDNYIS